jgi:hypothetical protein
VTNGTFYELLSACRNTVRFKVYGGPFPHSYMIRRALSLDSISNSSFQFKSLIQRIPKLNETFEECFKENSSCIPAFLFLLKDVQLDVDIFSQKYGLISEDRLKDLLNLTAENPPYPYLNKTPHNFLNVKDPFWHANRYKFSKVTSLWDTLPNFESFEEVSALITPFSNGEMLSPIAKLFLLSYFLGMLVRYYPTHWMKLQSRGKGDFIRPLLQEASNLIAEEYPKLILDEMAIE